MAERNEILLMDEVKDKITGMKGVVIAVTNWFNGCQRVLVQPRELCEGKPVDSSTFDVEQLELVKRPKPVEKKKAPTGGPMPDAQNRPNAKR